MDRYLFVSDAHKISKFDTARIIYNAARNLKINGVPKEVDAIIIGGDISGNSYRPEEKQSYLEFVLAGALMTKKEIFFVPGNHESIIGSEIFLMELAHKYDSKFMTALKEPVRFKRSDHNLIVLPGGDLASEDSFMIACPDTQSGYFRNGESFSKNHDLSNLISVIGNSKTDIILSHNAPYLGIQPGGIDEAHLARNTKTNKKMIMAYLMDEMIHRYGNVLAKVKMEEEGWVPANENVGNKFLGDMVKRKTIMKSISGHVHEAAGRASDSLGIEIGEGFASEELFINGGFFDDMKATYLEVEGSLGARSPKARFFRVNLADYK